MLLDAGANANTRDAAGLTALMRAAEGGHRAVVEALVEILQAMKAHVAALDRADVGCLARRSPHDSGQSSR